MKETSFKAGNFIIYVLLLLCIIIYVFIIYAESISGLRFNAEITQIVQKLGQSSKLDWVPAITKEDGPPYIK